MNIFNNVFGLLGEKKAIYPKVTSISNIFNVDFGDAISPPGFTNTKKIKIHKYSINLLVKHEYSFKFPIMFEKTIGTSRYYYNFYISILTNFR